MIGKIKAIKLIFLLLIFLSTAYLIWRMTRPIALIDAYPTNDIVIKNPPLTDKELITWWGQNKNVIEEKFNVPKPRPNGTFMLTIWDIGGGYEKFDESTGIHFIESAPDQFCFENMKAQKKCLSKDKRIMLIHKTQKGYMEYIVDGAKYRQKKNGEIVKDLGM